MITRAFEPHRIFRMLAVVLAAACAIGAGGCARVPADHDLGRTWEGYKRAFVTPDGRVVRPESADDTVSEGQAYTMLRAVWMNDRETFDRCFRWTEKNLSRQAEQGDSLLAWRWAEGDVTDWMPASDADVDYALALIFAGSKWKDAAAGSNLPSGYHDKARAVLLAVLEKETFRTDSGWLVLTPWIQHSDEPRVLNPGYFSPAHFKVFYRFTGDPRWMELADASYVLLGKLTAQLGETAGVGLVPDWAELDAGDRWIPAPGRSDRFGWDAVRMPIRLGLDDLWFGEKRAAAIFNSGMADFLSREWKRGSIRAGYRYNGKGRRNYENAVFYAASYFVFRAARPDLADAAADRALGFLRGDSNRRVYHGPGRYFTNALSWMSEAARQGILKNLFESTKETVL